MIKIITDSTADIDAIDAQKLNIDIIPLKVILGQETYKDRVDLQPNQFYNLLAESSVLPTTSQPSPQDFLDVFQKAKEAKDHLIVMTISSGISGTYQSANIAKDLLEYDNIHIIDSYTTTQALKLLVLKAVALRDHGMAFEDMIVALEKYKQRVTVLAVVDTLEYLYKGGRMSKTAATAGTLLKVKPIIGFKDGKLEMLGKARGMAKATLHIVNLIKKDGEIDYQEPVCIAYTGNNDGIEKFEQTLRQELDITNVHHGYVGPVIGTHTGPGLRAIAYVKKEIND